MADQEPQFDRQVFVAHRQSEAPRQSFSAAGLLFLIVVAAVIGLGAYVLIKGGHLPLLPPENPDLTQIAQKLDEIEKRIEQLEKRRRTEPAPAPAKNEPTAGSPPAALPPQTIIRVDPGTRQQRDFTPAIAGQEKRLTEQDRRMVEMQKEFGTLRGDVAAGREAWEATTDRVGNVSGELSTQRSEIARNRQSLNQLAARFERTRLPFRLQKRVGAQRIGPVWLELGGTDTKKQRYTMRLFVDDKWVEVKDRALHEPVEFYIGGGATAAELVVSVIHKDEVVGYLALPQEGTKR